MSNEVAAPDGHQEDVLCDAVFDAAAVVESGDFDRTLAQAIAESARWKSLFRQILASGGIFENRNKMMALASVILFRSDLHGLSDDVIMRVIRLIATYKSLLSAMEVGELADVLEKLFDHLPKDSKALVVMEIEDHGPIGRVFLGFRTGGKIGKLFGGYGWRNRTMINIVIAFYSRSKFVDLALEDQKIVSEAHGRLVNKLIDAIGAGAEASILLGIELLEANFVFRIDGKEPEQSIPYDRLMALMESSSRTIKCAVARLFVGLPVTPKAMRADVLLLTVITHMCKHMDETDDKFTVTALTFIEQRKGVQSFLDFVTALFLPDDTFFGGVVVCASLELFETYDFLAVSAFPRSVSLKRLLYVLSAVEYISRKGQFTRSVLDATLPQLMLIYTSPSILKNEGCVEAAVKSINDLFEASVEFSGVLETAFIAEMLNIGDKDVMNSLVVHLSKTEFVVRQMSRDAFCRLFCHVFVILDRYADIAGICRIFGEPRDFAKPVTLVALIDACVPEEYRERLREMAREKHEVSPRLVILVAAMPGLTSEGFRSIFAFIVGVEKQPLFGLMSEFLTVAGTLYIDFIIEMMVEGKIGECASTYFFAQKKLRLRAFEIVRSAFSALAKILESRVIDALQQERLWRGVCTLFALSSPGDVREIAVQMRQVFQVLVDIAPRDDQYKMFLTKDFFYDFPLFLANVVGSNDLALTCIDILMEVVCDENVDMRSPETVAAMIARLAPLDETLMDCVTKFMSVKFVKRHEPMRFFSTCLAIVSAAKKRGISVDQCKLTSFLIRTSRYIIDEDVDLRAASIACVSAVFDIGCVVGMSYCLSLSEVMEVANDVFLTVSRKVSCDFVNGVVSTLAGKRAVELQHVCILAAFFETHNAMSDVDEALICLFDKYASLPRHVQVKFDVGIVHLAMHSMKQFITLVLKTEYSFQVAVFRDIRRRHEIRSIFLDEFRTYLNEIPLETKSLDIFGWVKLIVVSTCDMPLGHVVSEIFMWLALIQNVPPKISAFRKVDGREPISEILNALHCRIGGSDTIRWMDLEEDRIKGAGPVTELLLTLNLRLSDVKMIAGECMTLIDSPNMCFVIAVASFFVHARAKSESFSSTEATELHNVLDDGIIRCFSHSSPQVKLEVASLIFDIMPVSLIDHVITPAICNCILDGIILGEGVRPKKSAARLLGQVARNIPPGVFTSSLLFTAIEIIFNELEFDAVFIKLLHSFLDIEIAIDRFSNIASTLSIRSLFALFAHDESEAMSLLQRLCGDDDIASIIQRSCGNDEVARCGLMLIETAKPYSLDVIMLLCSIAESVMASNDPGPDLFKNAVIEPLLGAISVQNSAVSDKARRTIDSIVTANVI